MLDGGGEYSERDLRRLAELHVEAIADSIPSFLGSDYARHLYRYLTTSAREVVLTERSDGHVVSACVVSFEPDSVQGRIARATWGSLLLHALAALPRRADLRAFVVATLRDALRGGATPFPGPEIVYLFTDAALRGGGLGQRLVERTDALVTERGEDTYFVQTIDEPGNRALRFYENAGFVRIGERHERGRRFALFHRKLSTA